jgi:uncharacterized membrane protein YobD (UPF0266 family)
MIPQSIEETVYDILSWIYLYPITFFDLLFKPMSFLEKMRIELTKDNSDRYDTRLSPIIFYLFSAVVPFILMIRAERLLTKEELATVPNITDAAALLTATTILLPFIWAGAHMSASKTGYSKKIFRIHLAEQCYLFSPLWVGIISIMIFDCCGANYFIFNTKLFGAILLLFILLFHIAKSRFFIKSPYSYNIIISVFLILSHTGPLLFLKESTTNSLSILFIALLGWFIVTQWRLFHRKVNTVDTFFYIFLAVSLTIFLYYCMDYYFKITGQRWLSS